MVVEDEADIATLLAMYCKNEGWDVHTADDGASGLAAIRARQPDFVILDVGLPGDVDGFGVCRELRKTSDVPILFLTARDEEIDRILGLEIGADDYVTKPFSPREVVARIKAVLRRGVQPTPNQNTTFGSVMILTDRHEVRVGEELVVLAAQEWALLDSLVANQGTVLSRQQLLDLAWGVDWIGDPRTVDVHVRQLRRKLGDDLPLVTVRGAGYRLG